MKVAANWRRLIGLELDNTSGSTGLGPDFPGHAGDREKGRFREGPQPRLTAVAVVDNEGQAVGFGVEQKLDVLIEEIRLLRHALVLTGLAAEIEEPISGFP